MREERRVSMKKKSMTINSTIYEKYNNGFREGIEGSNAQISQVPSRPRSIWQSLIALVDSCRIYTAGILKSHRTESCER